MASDNEYFNSMRIIFYAIKMFGILPFISLHRDTRITRLLVFKMMTVLSVFTYAAVFSIEFLYVVQMGYAMVMHFDFNIFVRSTAIIISRLFILIIPIFTWNKSEKIHAYWKNWMYYQKEIEKITGVRYSSPVRWKIPKFCGFALVGTSTITWLIRNRFPRHFVINANILTFTYVMITMHLIPIYWYANCMFVGSIIKTITKLLRESIRKGNPEELENLLRMWLALCDLNAQFNASHSVLFFAYFSLSIINTIGAVYSSLTSYLLVDDKSVSLTHLLTASVSIAGIVLFCESAHSLSRSIKTEVEEIMLNNNTINMDQKLLSSVALYLNVIEARKPEINLNGYGSLKRSDIASIFAGIINYLIILKQFSAN